MYIKTGDKVQVIAGKERGKVGSVIRVDLKRNRVVVKDLNMVKRHKRPSPGDQEGGIKEREASIHASNVLLYSEKQQRGVRVSYRYEGQDGQYYTTQKAALATFAEAPASIKKVRFCVKTGEVF